MNTIFFIKIHLKFYGIGKSVNTGSKNLLEKKSQEEKNVVSTPNKKERASETHKMGNEY